MNNNFIKVLKDLNINDLSKFIDAVENILETYNQFASDIRLEYIYENNEENLEMLLQGLDALDIVNKIYHGIFNKGDAFLTYDGYGNIETFGYSDFMTYIDNDFVAWADENGINLQEVAGL